MYEQMRAIMENINGGVSAVAFVDGRIVHVFANDYYYSMLGYTREQFAKELPGGAFDLIYPDDRDMTIRAATAAFNANERFELEYRVIKRDGTVIWTRCNGSCCRVEGYDSPVQLAVSRDITKEKNAGERLMAANQQLRLLNDTAHDLLAQTDAQIGIMTVLEKVRSYFHADRAYVFEINELKQVYVNTYEVCAPGIDGAIDMLQAVPFDEVPFWHPEVFKTRYINIEDVDSLGDDRAQERELLQMQGISSLIAVPLNRDGKLIGFMGVDNPKKQRSHVGHLQAIGDYMAIILTRRDLNAKIANDNDMLRVLMNDTPGGFVRMRLMPDGAVVPIYLNDGFCNMVGMTREMILERCDEDPMWGVHPDDMDILRRAINDMMSLGEARGYRFRLRRGDGSFIWMMTFGRRTLGSSGEVIFNVYYTEVSLTDQEKKELSFREMLPVALNAMMGASNDLSFLKDMDMKYICCSESFADMVGLNSASEIAGKTVYDLFDKDLADDYFAHDSALLKSGKAIVDQLERLPCADRSIRYATISRYLLTGPTGNVLGLYGVGRDITSEREASARLNLLTNSVPGGIASCVSMPEGVSVTYFNDGLCNMLGYTREQYQHLSSAGGAGFKDLALGAFGAFGDDARVVEEQLMALVGDGAQVDCTYRARTGDGGQKWVNLKCGVAERRGEMCTFTAVMFDVTDQKAALDAARIHEEEMQAAMSHMGKMICEYEPATKTLNIPEASALRYDVPAVLDDFPASLLKKDVIDEAYADVFSEFFEQIRRGEKTGSAEYREKWANGDYHWARAEFSTIFDSSGKPVKAIVAVEDTTSQHARFELEKNRPMLGEENLMVHALFNLSTGQTLEYNYANGEEVPVCDRTALNYGGEILDLLLINKGERQRYRELNDPKELLKRFEKGETELSIDYRRLLPDGEIIWVRNLMHMVRQPGGNDVLLFDYFYNIEDEKTLELMNNLLISQSCDYMARVSGRSGRFDVIGSATSSYGMLPPSGESIEAALRYSIKTYVHPEDREMVRSNISLKGTKRSLSDKDRFEFTFRYLQPDGEIRYKKITQYYLDREREIIIITREDVSDFVRGEMRKNELLSTALNAANLANQAKTQFLSRMSHELRTPMNAIIGLSALSATELHDPEIMEDSINKISMSAQYLLSLINDILEMSRIESGRMTLSEAPFDFARFISQVNTIIRTQAEKKGVDYEAIVGSYTEPIYVGDATKLQEILVNVLGNAIKFTPPGGRVTLTIEQLRFAKQRATMRFTVSDTGIGIDESFMPHLFNSFTQESAHFTSSSGGTGLGLAITKNLVEMMNGQISVKSIKSVGSVFTIEVLLGITLDSRQYLDKLASISLKNMRALVVDDDAVVCKSTQGILSTMGASAQWVSSGIEAVEHVKSEYAAGRRYDVIFMDWNMPDMDGIEATRSIRDIVGEDATIIIMTAYDWRSVEAQARKAGVSQFVEKPLFQSSIARVFEKALSNEADARADDPFIYDFKGKRILLVEDHPLNVEVARRLLEKAGAQVSVASNGLEAIEAFATEKDGWFDVILMDIRMPVMDGLTAAKNIRALKKAGSKTIPIVAMTANAFDEDVELSLGSGMNAHLAKPIEPSVLFSTLHRLLKGEE